MRLALASLIVACSAASVHATWGRPWYYGPPPVYYVPMYYTPLYYVPLVECCPCPLPAPATPALPPRKEMPRGSSAETPYSPIVPAASSVPAEEKPENKLPKLDVPMPKETPKLVSPKVELPMGEAPTIVLPSAAKKETPLIEVPSIGTPSAPKLELPPLPPIEVKKSTSNFRAAAKASLVPVDGTAPADGRYRVGFFNMSDSEVTLTVNGQEMKLPKRSSVSATVAKSFRWSLDGAEAENAEITAAGAEVIIK